MIQLFPNGKTSGTTLGSKKFTVPEGGKRPAQGQAEQVRHEEAQEGKGKLKCTVVVKTTDAAGQTTTVKVNYTFKKKTKG